MNVRFEFKKETKVINSVKIKRQKNDIRALTLYSGNGKIKVN